MTPPAMNGSFSTNRKVVCCCTTVPKGMTVHLCTCMIVYILIISNIKFVKAGDIKSGETRGQIDIINLIPFLNWVWGFKNVELN